MSKKKLSLDDRGKLLEKIRELLLEGIGQADPKCLPAHLWDMIAGSLAVAAGEDEPYIELNGEVKRIVVNPADEKESIKVTLELSNTQRTQTLLAAADHSRGVSLTGHRRFVNKDLFEDHEEAASDEI